MVHIHNEYYTAIKKNEIMPFATTWIYLGIIILSEVNQTKKCKYHMVSLMKNQKKWYKWTYLQNRFTDLKNELMVIRGEGWGAGILRVWDWHVHTDIFKTNNQQRPTVYSTGNSASYSVIT